MKSVLTAICVAFIALAFSGCMTSTSTTAVETPPPAGTTLVKLKLPGMVCGGCAEEVKDTLVKVDGVSNIVTDPVKHECSFWSTKSADDIKAKLDELAKSSDKIAGWERLN
ncbi:Heavy-metal-associated domain protein [Anatilimnocola aggregata]|uniref:Heavy-metal-associated domain protein n=1 Tax=Anatilimnocola aggregata TaxID=2528021 RepID=A0A517YAP2_9BACT|nr:heavy-metal-associated domain-containing protein [Anatilimnocola aggregata]QDU27305.1 Heavy-metal-associated domain protein [Anatilimnocola aggregata]